VPGVGLSSPVLSEGRLHVTAALRDENGAPGVFLFSFRADTGALERRTLLFPTGELPPREGHERNVAANATVIVHEGRIYAYVGHHGAICLDRDGRVLWRTNRLRFDPVPPNGASPIIAGDLLIYVADCATAPFVMALDRHTGAVRWKTRRVRPGKMKFTFGAPLAIEAGGRRQIVVVGSGAITALDAADGREIWRVRCARDAVGPQPVFAHGLVFVSAGYLRTDLFAIRPDGAGDVTNTHVAWRVSKGAPLTPALVAVGTELFAVNDAGIATCWDAATGRMHWQERLPGNYSAAPIAAGGRIVFINEDGLATVVKAAREFAVLATNPLGEMTLASPAVSDGALFVRTLGHVWRIGSK
jgi:outer membrane protein assembly factor BamB